MDTLYSYGYDTAAEAIQDVLDKDEEDEEEKCD
jgi:hypothetical protein